MTPKRLQLDQRPTEPLQLAQNHTDLLSLTAPEVLLGVPTMIGPELHLPMEVDEMRRQGIMEVVVDTRGVVTGELHPII